MYGRPSSRRFACDRCRNYKLRCERHAAAGAGSGCERCVKAGLMCKTTGRSTAASAASPHPHDGFGPEPEAGGPVHAASPPPPSTSSCRNALGDAPAGQGSVNPMHLARPPAASPPGRRPGPGGHPDAGAGDGLGLDEADQHHVDSSFDFMMVDFGCNNDALSAATTDSDHVGLAGSADVFGQSPQSPGSEDLQSPLKDAMTFCAALIEHYHSFRPAPGSPPGEASPKLTERLIQSALVHTSRLLDILESLTAADAPPHGRRTRRQSTGDASSSARRLSSAVAARAAPQPGLEPPCPSSAAYPDSDGNDSTSSSRHESYDVLLMTTLVTSYVYLVRMWRSVFSLLHHLLLATGLGHMRGLFKLPSLQFGGFRILDNPGIQIQVLFELQTDLFQRIEAILGIANSVAVCRYVYGEDREHKGQVLGLNPVAVSIRETLLHQERMRAATEEGSGDLSLKDITTKVKQLLAAQG